MAQMDLITGITRLSLAHQNSFTTADKPPRSTGGEGNFALGLDHDNRTDRLAVTSWGDRLLLFSASSLTQVDSRSCPSGSGLTQPRFGRRHRDRVFAASRVDGPLMWDLRSPNGPAVKFGNGSLRQHGVEFVSFDVDKDDRLLAAGTSATKNGDAFLAYWDARAGRHEFLGVYEQCHSEDINALSFNPARSSALLSGASDGLVCVFDLTATNEDDALTLTCNPDRSVARVGWGKDDSIICISDMDTFHAWAADGDVRIEATELPDGWKYIVDSVDDCLLLLGNHDGALCLWEAGEGNTELKLDGGHSDTVRCVVAVAPGGLITGGEDGQLCCWQAEGKGARVGKRKAGKGVKWTDSALVTKRVKT